MRANAVQTPQTTTITLATIAGLALALASAPALAQGPLEEPFPATLAVTELDGTIGFRLEGESGQTAAGVGDVNGDGIADLVIGMTGAEGGGLFRAGAAAIVFGREGGLPAIVSLDDLDGTNGFRLEGAIARQGVGSAVAAAGDVNGDGIDDVLVGAEGTSPYGSDPVPSGAYVVFGSRDGFAPTLSVDDLDGTNGFHFAAEQPGNGTGLRLSATDLNGDGLGDVLVSISGGLGVVLGSRDGFAPTLARADLDGIAGFIINGAFSARDAGDVNGDGVGDLIASGTGSVLRVVFGRDAFPASADIDSLLGDGGGVRIAHTGLTGFADLGYDQAGVGDVNGDGVGDLAIGIPNAGIDGGYGFGTGQTYIVYGREGGFDGDIDLDTLAPGAGFRADGQALHAQSGRFIGGAGDLNGDGFDDVAIGAPYEGSQLNAYSYLDRGAGAAYVVFGGEDTPPVVDLGEPDGELVMRIAGDRSMGKTRFGWDANPAGDVNADGVDDVVLRRSGAETYVLYGRGAAGCVADLDGDGELTIFDFLVFQNLFDAGDLRADFDGDGVLSLFDFLAFQNAFDAGC